MTEPHIRVIDDERSKAVFFALLGRDDGVSFEFADMLRLWFHDDPACLAKFLEWLSEHGLEIRKKNKR